MASRSNVQTWLLEPSLPHSQYQSSTSPESRCLTRWGAVESFPQEMDLTSTHYLDVLACIRWDVAWHLFPLACMILDWSFDQEYKRKIPLAGEKKKSTKWIKFKTSSLMKWCLQVTRPGLGATDCEQPLISVQTPSTVRYTGMLKTLRRRNMGMYFTHSFITSICKN